MQGVVNTCGGYTLAIWLLKNGSIRFNYLINIRGYRFGSDTAITDFRLRLSSGFFLTKEEYVAPLLSGAKELEAKRLLFSRGM